MRLFVTGGTGFIGSRVVRRLAGRGSATGVATSELEADVLEADDLEAVLARDSELAAQLYRALAVTLAERLRRSDNAVVAMPVLGIE